MGAQRQEEPVILERKGESKGKEGGGGRGGGEKREHGGQGEGIEVEEKERRTFMRRTRYLNYNTKN